MSKKVAAAAGSRNPAAPIPPEVRKHFAKEGIKLPPEIKTLGQLHARLSEAAEARNEAEIRELVSSETARSKVLEKQRDANRQRGEFRGGLRREKPPRGHRFTDTGSVEALDEPQIAFHVTGTKGPSGELETLTSIGVDVGPNFYRPITDADRWMADKLSTILEDAAGDVYVPVPGEIPGAVQRVPAERARAYRLDQVRRAYEAATGWPSEHEWQRVLRWQVKDALHERQGKRLRKPSEVAGSHTGAAIVRYIGLSCPPGSVPKGLKAPDVEQILKTATLTRGGGGGTAKRRTNWEVAVEALILKVTGGEPFQPRQ